MADRPVTISLRSLSDYLDQATLGIRRARGEVEKARAAKKQQEPEPSATSRLVHALLGTTPKKP